MHTMIQGFCRFVNRGALLRAAVLAHFQSSSAAFRPASSIQRCEVAAILVRMFTEAGRISITLN